MNVVFLSPHFPPPMYMYCARLHDAGATVLGLADTPYDQLRPELRSVLTEYYRVTDMHDPPRGLARSATRRHGYRR